MTATTAMLTEFLLARIAEDEASARAAIDSERPGTHWRWFNDDDTASIPDSDTGGEYLTYPTSLRTIEEFPTGVVGDLPAFAISHAEEVMTGVGLHIARHDPARVLAECEAKRRIVAGLTAVLAQSRNREQIQNARTTLAHLAAVYADHADYREEWRP